VRPTEPIAPIAAYLLVAPDASTEVRAAAGPAAERLATEAGGIVVATCHRVEVYLPLGAAVDGAGGSAHPAASEAARDLERAGARRLDGEAAAGHAISLTLGLESAVLAEDQLLHQVRTSVTAARAGGALSPELGGLFELALRAGRTARSWRPERPRSLADLALERVGAALGGVIGRRLLIVGAGEMGRLTAVAAVRAGAEAVVSSPRAAHAASLAGAVGATTVPFDPAPADLAVDAVVVALAGPWTMSADARDALASVAVVVDLSMPAALAADLVVALGSRHLGLDELAAGEGSEAWRPALMDGSTGRYRARLESLRDRTLATYLDRLTARDAAAVAGALAERVERERAAELDALWRRLPHLPPTERAAIEGMTRHLARRLFRAPLERLGSDPDGRRRRAAEELFGL
jgi:glutamyl-tRNA reductase